MTEAKATPTEKLDFSVKRKALTQQP